MILRWLSRRCVRDNWHADHDAHPSAAPVASFLPWCRFQSVPKRLACAWSQDTGRETSSSARCTSRQSAHWSSASRYTMLVHLAHDHQAETVRDGLISVVKDLPQNLRHTLTWDQGAEMSEHAASAMATDMKVFFCDPASATRQQRKHQRPIASILPQRHRPVAALARPTSKRGARAQRSTSKVIELGESRRAPVCSTGDQLIGSCRNDRWNPSWFGRGLPVRHSRRLLGPVPRLRVSQPHAGRSRRRRFEDGNRATR